MAVSAKKSVDFAYSGYYNEFSKGGNASIQRGKGPEIEGGN